MGEQIGKDTGKSRFDIFPDLSSERTTRGEVDDTRDGLTGGRDLTPTLERPKRGGGSKAKKAMGEQVLDFVRHGDDPDSIYRTF